MGLDMYLTKKVEVHKKGTAFHMFISGGEVLDEGLEPSKFFIEDNNRYQMERMIQNEEVAESINRTDYPLHTKDKETRHLCFYCSCCFRINSHRSIHHVVVYLLLSVYYSPSQYIDAC